MVYHPTIAYQGPHAGHRGVFDPEGRLHALPTYSAHRPIESDNAHGRGIGGVGGWLNPPEGPQQVNALQHASGDYVGHIGAWQPPHAPRMSAAAARASSLAAAYPGGAAWFGGHPPPNQHAAFHGTHGHGSWYPNLHDGRIDRQPQTHQDLEHQLILHHQLSKLHENRYAHLQPGGREIKPEQQRHAFSQAVHRNDGHARRASDRLASEWQAGPTHYDAGRGSGLFETWSDGRFQRIDPHDHAHHSMQHAEVHRDAQGWHDGTHPSLTSSWHPASVAAAASAHVSQLHFDAYGRAAARPTVGIFQGQDAPSDFRRDTRGWKHPDDAQVFHQHATNAAEQQHYWSDQRDLNGAAWYDDDVRRRYRSALNAPGYADEANQSYQQTQWTSAAEPSGHHPQQLMQGFVPGNMATGTWQGQPQLQPLAHHVGDGSVPPATEWNDAALGGAVHAKAQEPFESLGHGDWDASDQERLTEAVPEAMMDEYASVPPPSAELEENQAKGPAPPSPDTLDKSSVPIASFGAQIVWNACAAFFDPELLRQAQQPMLSPSPDVEDGSIEHPSSGMTTSVPSSSSTPSPATPLLSPWTGTAHAKGNSREWNAFQSPFGPENTAHLRAGQAGLSLSSSSALVNTEAVNQLHRLAVGAGTNVEANRGAARYAKAGAHRRRTPSTQPGPTQSSASGGGHSSGNSSATSSEPGTPSSLGSRSPSADSIAETQSDGAAFSTAPATVGLSLDRSQSESSVYPQSKMRTTSSPVRRADRVRDSVLSALRLVSVQWRWSANPENFVSLVTASDGIDNVQARRSPGRAGSLRCSRSPRDPVSGAVSTHASDPSPAFRRFTHQVLSQTLLSPTAFLLGLLYALRLPYLAVLEDGSVDLEAVELFAQPTSAAPFKLFTLGMMIANKHLDDNTFTNKTWNEVTGIPLLELNQIEAYFLKKCNYEVTVPDDTWVAFLQRVKAREEMRALDDGSCNGDDPGRNGERRMSIDKAQLPAAVDQQCRKRMLIVLEEALSPFDAVSQFRLDGSPLEGASRSETVDGESPSREDQGGSTIGQDAWGRMHQRQRPSSVPHAHHQHCHSAPAIATSLGTGEDLFDDEHSPFRPSELGRKSCQDHRGALSRTHSDFESRHCRPLAPSIASLKSHGTTISAPLVPSALLNSSRALLHGTAFAPLATAAWSHR